jgi:hypothetical protein
MYRRSKKGVELVDPPASCCGRLGRWGREEDAVKAAEVADCRDAGSLRRALLSPYWARSCSREALHDGPRLGIMRLTPCAEIDGP